MKKITALMMVVMIFTLSAALEEYDRKSISIFKMDVTSSAMSVPQQDVDMIYQKIYDKFVNLGRFDYNPIPAGVTDPAELFKIIKEYTITKIEERAAKQWDIKNEYYGSNFVTGENVDKIINGAYIFFPRLENYALTKNKTGDDFTANIGVAIDIYSAVNAGTPEAPVWEPKLETTVRATGSSAFSNLFDLALNDKKKDKRAEAVKSAANGMILFMEKEVKKVDMFKIKALAEKVVLKKDEISFNFGKNVGVHMGDSYTVGYKQKDASGKEKYIETGFLKVRRVYENQSAAQLMIVNQQKGTKEADLFNEYDQFYEYPLVNLTIFLTGGECAFKYWDDSETTLKENDTNMSPFIGMSIEYNLDQFIHMEELYMNISGDLLFAQPGKIGVEDTETTTGIAEIGLTKKYFKRQLGWYIGADFGYMGLSLKNDATGQDGDFYSFGFRARSGINYLINKNLILDIGTGYRFYSELYDENDEKVGEDGWLLPNGLVIKAGIGYTL
ncbi:MAG TPA: hypothetical protein PLK90_05405 [Clostridiales bacterium]|nr:hypothetical protein [Clostridiales bacterium]HQP69818.1 hypothetical protein [Clostridiales bacterium]